MNATDQLPLPLAVQRWRNRRDSYRPRGEPIDPRRFGVELVEQRDARPFVIGQHYAASYPAARRSVGLYRTHGHEAAELVGVAVFSVGVQHELAARRWCGLPGAVVVELGRFVLLDDVEANGETWFLRRAFDAIAAELPEVRAVLSYSDPAPRTTAGGLVITPGHVGTIYQAHNGRHVGRSSSRVLHLDPAGRVVSGRSQTKIRKGERGAGSEIDRLVSVGAPRPRVDEDPAAWLARALTEGPFRRLKHTGNHAYVWPVGDRQRETLAGLPAALPYPKRVAA